MIRPKIIMLFLSLFLTVSCNNDEAQFTGSSKTTDATVEPKTEKPLPPVVTKEPHSKVIKTPKNSVTVGSFSVGTIPERPNPLESYQIVIEVLLPNNVESYRLRDLSGTVTGTDGYTQEIRDTIRGVLEDKSLPIQNGKAIHIISVPGGETLIQDVVRVRSELLDEEQTLTILF